MTSDTLCTEQKRKCLFKIKTAKNSLDNVLYTISTSMLCQVIWLAKRPLHLCGGAQGSDLRAPTQGLVPRLFLDHRGKSLRTFRKGAKSLTSVMPLLMSFPLGTKNYRALCKAMRACCINRKWTCVQGYWSQTPDQRVFLPLAFVIVVHLMHERRKVYNDQLHCKQGLKMSKLFGAWEQSQAWEWA